jgi:hypothetical protein
LTRLGRQTADPEFSKPDVQHSRMAVQQRADQVLRPWP